LQALLIVAVDPAKEGTSARIDFIIRQVGTFALMSDMN